MSKEMISIPFKMDPLWAIRTLLKLHFDKKYNFNDDYSIATRYSLSEVLYTNELTEAEIQEIGVRYSNNHDLDGNIDLSGEPEQIEEMFSYIFELDRYKEEHWKNILAGNGPYDFSVIDLEGKKEYHSSRGEHYQTIFNIIEDVYWDKFENMTQKNKDNFILDNFRLV